MSNSLLVITIVVLVAFLLVQFIKFASLVLKIKKSEDLNRERNAESKDWEFVKDLY
ncbi:MAG TPA: hypothetical protein VGB84_06825 [Arachidicoccus sp.]